MTENKPFLSAIILGAGKSERMGCNKITMKLGSKTVIERTIAVFEACEDVDEIIIAASEDDIAEFGALVKECDFAKVTGVVKGGETRQESVKNALAAVSREAEYVAVHDGARPLVRVETISNVFDAAQKYGGAVAGLKSVDTLKAVDEDMMITSTIDREMAVMVRTPQIFRRGILEQAHEKAAEDSFLGTDECMLAERIGCAIKVVESCAENIKLTYPSDAMYAIEILKERGAL